MGELLSPARLLIHRLSTGATLSRMEQQAIIDIVGPGKAFARGQEIVADGSCDPVVWLLAEGFAFRAKSLRDGRRQIIGLMIPGELTERGRAAPGGSGHTVLAATPAVAHSISRHSLEAIAEQSPAIAKTLLADEARRKSALGELALSLGRRTAEERVAHFLYETFVRLRAIGIADEQGYELPLSQAELADVVGLSPVHVNRTLQALRARGLFSWVGNRINILNASGMSNLADFDQSIEQLASDARRRATEASRWFGDGQQAAPLLE